MIIVYLKKKELKSLFSSAEPSKLHYVHNELTMTKPS